MQNIVITGGCGFIGVNLIRFLMKTDESVCIRVVDNLSVGQLEDLEEIQRSEVGGQRANRPELSWWSETFGIRGLQRKRARESM